MNTDVVKAFNAELTSIYDQRPPLSKKKIQDVSKAALKAKTYYKHVVFSVEKFLAKCKVEYKIPVLYVVDSIIRASKHQFKEKDVFGPRFLKNFAKTLNDFLQCPVNEQCRVVRTLNLWGANGVFEESVLASFKEQCRNMGIETDVELVERAVKGKRADMTIYGGTYIKKEHRSHSKYEAKTPPMPPPNAGDKSQLAVKEEPSEEIPQGCISERELLNIMQSAGCDYGGSFSTDLALLRKAHSIFCDALVQRQSAIIAEQKAGNIKNLLSSQFDYSDEEDSGDEAKKNEVNEPKPMTHDQVVQMAENLVKDPTVMDAFKTLHQERVMVLNQVALIAQQREKLINDLQHQQHHPHHQHQQQHQQQQQQQQQPNPTTVGMPMGVPPPSLGQLNTGIPPGLPGSGIAGLTAGFPLGQGIGNIANLAGLGQLTGFAGLQQIVPNNGNNAQGILGMLNPLGLLPQSAGLGRGQGLSQQNIEEIMAQQQIKMNNSLNSQNATSLGGLLGTVPNAQLSLDDLDPRREMDDKDSHRRKRSRSTERDDHKRSRASRSKDKDRSDRERRKLGLPPNSEGLTMIASKTLWFGRLPPLITDNEIKMALRPTGEVERISIISSKACAYVAMDSRKNAYEVVHKLGRDMKINGKTVKIGWAQGNGAKVEPYSKWWDSEKGVTLIPWNELPGDLERLCDGAYLDVESLPPNKKGMYSDAGVLSVMIPSGSDPTGMELSSPQASPPRVPGLSFDGTSPMKPHEFAPFGVPPPLPLNSMPGNPNVLPPGLQNPLQFPMRLPPMGRPPIPNQALIPPNVTLPPPTPNTPQPPFNSHNPVGNMFSPTRGNFRGGRGRGFAPGPSRGGNAGRGGFRGGINAGCSDGDRGDWGNDRKDRESRWNGRDDRNSRWENRDDRERDSDRRRERDADRGERRRSRWGDSREERGDRRDRWDEDRDRYRDDRFNRDRRRDRDDGGRRDRGGRRERESPKYSDGENDQTNVNDSEHTAAATEPNVASFPSGDDAVVTSTTDDITAIAESESKRQFEEQIRGDIKSGEDLLETAVAAPASEN